MNPKDLVNKIYENYRKTVMPLIEKGEYVEASKKIYHLIFHINKEQRYREMMMANISEGACYIASLRLLFDNLEEGDEKGIERAMGSVEIYYAKAKQHK